MGVGCKHGCGAGVDMAFCLYPPKHSPPKQTTHLCACSLPGARLHGHFTHARARRAYEGSISCERAHDMMGAVSSHCMGVSFLLLLLTLTDDNHGVGQTWQQHASSFSSLFSIGGICNEKGQLGGVVAADMVAVTVTVEAGGGRGRLACLHFHSSWRGQKTPASH